MHRRGISCGRPSGRIPAMYVSQHRRVSFSYPTIIAFIESYWELIEDDPDAWY